MGQRMSTFYSVLLALIASQATSGGKDLLVPDPIAKLHHLYEAETVRIATSIERFRSEHEQRKALVVEPVDGDFSLSIIWREPIFYLNEFASVFWSTNRIVVALMERGALQSRAFTPDYAMQTLRERLVLELPKSEYALPLGGDGNVAMMGVFLDGTNALSRAFVIQTGSAYNRSGGKRLYGSDDSVEVYEILLKLRHWLRGKLVRRFGLFYLPGQSDADGVGVAEMPGENQ